MNLFTETNDMLFKHGKTPSDVRWVGSENYVYFSWDHFAEIADKEYNNGYGGTEVAYDLLIVGDDWWMERGEYDGSEWWSFKTMPQKPSNNNNVKSVFGNDTNLITINEE